MYGLEITRRLSEISGSRIVFQESGIYQTLKNLKKNGMVSTEWVKSNKGPKRKYYTLEEPGEELLSLFTENYILPIINTSTQLVREHFPDLGKKEKGFDPSK
jgi:PadR family transcriptional regulator PadR